MPLVLTVGTLSSLQPHASLSVDPTVRFGVIDLRILEIPGRAALALSGLSWAKILDLEPGAADALETDEPPT